MLRFLRDRLTAWPVRDRVLLGLAVTLAFAGAVRAVGNRAQAGEWLIIAPELPEPPREYDALPRLTSSDLMAAVARDPFRPDRSAPENRYRPSRAAKAAPSPADRPDRREPIPRYRLRGVATAPNSRLAILEGGRGLPGTRPYQPGDAIGEFRLELVEGDTVVLIGSDTTLVLRIERPWAGSR